MSFLVFSILASMRAVSFSIWATMAVCSSGGGGEPLNTIPIRLPPSPFEGGQGGVFFYFGNHVLQKEQGTVINARQSGAEPSSVK